MFKRYYTNTMRPLWKHKLFTLLNIFGLAISISACWIIYRIVSYEFSYEKDIPGKENIYRVVSGFVFDEKESYNGGAPAPLYQGIREQVNGLAQVVPVFGQWVNAVEANKTGDKPISVEEPQNIVATDAAYFDMLPYRWLIGNKATAFNAPESVVLTESRARSYFPGKKLQEIINQTLLYYTYNDTLQKVVKGIVADFTTPSEFAAQEFFSLPTKPYELAAWTNTNGSDKLYLQLKKGVAPDKILATVNTIASRKWKEFEQQRGEAFKAKKWYKLLPLTASHFSTYIDEYGVRKASKPVLFGLVGIGLFLLVLACINYINMSVARIPQRTKEIGVRKTLGSSQRSLIWQFLSETMFTALFAVILAFLLSNIGFGMLRDIIPEGVTLFGDALQIIGYAVVLIFAITLLAGIYPAWLITRVKTINIFRSITFNQKGNRRLSLQQALTVFQFVIALVFITSALIVGNQLQYMLSSNMGFNKDAVVLVDVPWKYLTNDLYKNKQFTLQNELKKITGVQGVSLGSTPMSAGFSSSQYEYDLDGKEPLTRQVYKKWVDTGYIHLYKMKLLSGRNLRVADTTNEFVINEAAVQAFGFATPQDALGKLIGQKGAKFPVVGVVSDFHLQDFYKKIEPVALLSEKDNLGSFNIKLDGRDMSSWQAVLKTIEKKWGEFYPPGTFAYKFYDESLKGMYQQERNLAKLTNIATFIAIFISCLGLFGLVTLTAFQRTKEIGIRKVLGASVASVTMMLSKDFIKLVGVAIIIAFPIAWYAMQQWLQDFAYRIHIEWWMFILAGGLALLIALCTVSFQAIKAALANPVKSLRTE